MSDNLSQYFTTYEPIQNYVREIARGNDTILEPSIGRGHLIASFIAQNARYPIHGYDIDESLLQNMIFTIDNDSQIMRCADFLQMNVEQLYSTIIMNPPYIRQGACKFVTKCFHKHLASRGEMICVMPRAFMRATHSQQIWRDMMTQGCITDIWFPNNEHLFAGATIDIIIFRYERNGIPQHGSICRFREELNPAQNRVCIYDRGNLQFVDQMRDTPIIRPQMRDMFDIYVGQVSGADKIFAHESGNIELLVRIQSTPMTRSFICAFNSLDELSVIAREHLRAHHAQLLARRIRAFSEHNWYQWGALRNAQIVRAQWGAPCIYVVCRTRDLVVATTGIVQWFSGAILCMIPKNNDIDCAQIARYINSVLRAQHLSAGRFIITHRALSESL